MKIIISTLIILILTMGVGLKFAFDKIFNLKQNITILKNSTIKLKEKNAKLLSKQKSIKKKFRERRKRITNRNFIRAEKQIAKAPAKMVPWVGIPVIIAMTSFEVEGYCENIKELKQFENNLFGTDQNNTSYEEEKICGMDIDNELKPMAEKQYEESKNWIINSTTDIYENAEKQFDKLF